MFFLFKDISINYDKRLILDNVTLDIEKGKVTTIIGKNGCGKSSLLKCLVRKNMYKGQILLDDKNLNKYSKKSLAKRLAYLPQIHEIPSDISVETLVSYGRYPYQKFGSSLSIEDKNIIDESIKLCGLDKLRNEMVSKLSGGEAQRAFIAMCISQQPEIFILDEPTTYLDISYQYEVLELVKKLNKEKNITILMVLHDLNLASRYSDYIYAINDKKVYAYGTPTKVITSETLLKIFNIKADIIEKYSKPYFIVDKIINERENNNEI